MAAKARWAMLRRALLSSVPGTEEGGSKGSGGAESEGGVSVRRHGGFPLLTRVPMPTATATATATADDTGCDGDGRQVLVSVDVGGTHLVLRGVPPSAAAPTAATLMGFNNTGNVCLWPSEEVLAFLLTDPSAAAAGEGGGEGVLPEMDGPPLRILELGAGMTGLAGLAVAAVAPPGSDIVITDGNEVSVDGLCANITGHAKALGPAVSIEGGLLRWEPDTDYADELAMWGGAPFDVILAADCLFFEDVHQGLINTLERLLAPSPSARIVMVAPSRTGSSARFLDRLAAAAEAGSTSLGVLASWTDASYHATIQSMHTSFVSTDPSYDPNIHLPLLTVLARRTPVDPLL